jgi:hypothetical protein
MILADTCILIDYFKKDKIVEDKVNEIGFENIVLNSIVVMELLVGAKNKNELNSIKKKLNDFDILETNQEIMDRATSLIEQYSLSHGLKAADAIIGATVKYYNIPLYTYNKKHFQFIEDLKFLG